MIRTKAKESRYGGADKICEVRAEKAMLLITVGKNTGSEAKETLIERNMSACSQAIELESVATVFEALIRAMMLPWGSATFSLRPESSCCCSSCSRSLATFRSRAVR